MVKKAARKKTRAAGGPGSARKGDPSARAQSAKKQGLFASTSKQQWSNLGNFFARYLVLIALMFGSAEGFRLLVGKEAPLELNFVYFPMFFLVVSGIFAIIHFDKLKSFRWSQNWVYTAIFGVLGFWNVGIYVWLKYASSIAFALSNPTTYLFLVGIFYGVGFSLLALAIFGFGFVRQFQKELLIISIVAIPYVSLTFLLRTYWNVFSTLVTKANVWLMSLVTSNVAHTVGVGDPSLAMESFQVIIGAPCSGVDSLLLFTGLYWFVGLLDFDLYNKTKLILLYPIGLIGTFAMSILRIFALMLIGAYHSADFALGAFHTNAGWIIFVVYFLTLMYFAMPWLKK